MYVQLLVRMQIPNSAGTPQNYQPGDFVDVGKQTARQWIADGRARVLDYARAGLLPAASGVQPWGENTRTAPEDLVADGIEFANHSPGPTLPFYRTLLWTGNAPLRRDTLAAGFNLLDTWHIALPLFDYNRLANSFGSQAEREKTEAVIRDLRVPVYDYRLMFVRRCTETENLLQAWDRETTIGSDLTLSFMRALYEVKPLVLALPTTWGNADGSDGYT